MKIILPLVLLYLFGSLQALAQVSTSPSLGDFLRYEDGTVQLRITQYHAFERCEGPGTRLATILVLMQNLVKSQRGMGPKGSDGCAILDKNQYKLALNDSNLVPVGFTIDTFTLVVATNILGSDAFSGLNPTSKDEFYYSCQNYKAPSDNGASFIWSSSRTDPWPSYGYVLKTGILLEGGVKLLQREPLDEMYCADGNCSTPSDYGFTARCMSAH